MPLNGFISKIQYFSLIAGYTGAFWGFMQHFLTFVCIVTREEIKHGVSSMGRAACVNNFKLEFPLSDFSIHIHVYVTK